MKMVLLNKGNNADNEPMEEGQPVLVADWLAREIGEQLNITENYDILLLKMALADCMYFVSTRREYQYQHRLRVRTMRNYARKLAPLPSPQQSYDYFAQQLQTNAIIGYCLYVGYNLVNMIGMETGWAERSNNDIYWDSSWGVGVRFLLPSLVTARYSYSLVVSVPAHEARDAIQISITSRSHTVTVNPFLLEIRIVRHDTQNRTTKEIHKETVRRHASKDALSELAAHLRVALTPIGAQPAPISTNIFRIIPNEVLDYFKQQLIDCIHSVAFANSPFVNITEGDWRVHGDKDTNTITISFSCSAQYVRWWHSDSFNALLPLISVAFSIETTLFPVGNRLRGRVEGNAQCRISRHVYTHIVYSYLDELAGAPSSDNTPPGIEMRSEFTLDGNIPLTDVMRVVTENALRVCTELTQTARTKYNTVPLLSLALHLDNEIFKNELQHVLLNLVHFRGGLYKIRSFVRVPTAGEDKPYYSLVLWATLDEETKISITADLFIDKIIFAIQPPLIRVHISELRTYLRLDVRQQTIQIEGNVRHPIDATLTLLMRANTPVAALFLRALAESDVPARVARIITNLLERGYRYYLEHAK